MDSKVNKIVSLENCIIDETCKYACLSRGRYQDIRERR